MKKLILVILAFVFCYSSFSQNCSSNLTRYCKIFPSAQLFISNCKYGIANVSMSEYKENTSGEEFTFPVRMIYGFGHADIPLGKVANTMWQLISKQLHGESGLLSTTKANFFPTRNERREFILAILIWDKAKSKWAIMSIPLNGVKTVFKGCRWFDLGTSTALLQWRCFLKYM
jgi:hypothetical protein